MNVCVVYTPRSGSQYYCANLAESLNCKNYSEILNQRIFGPYMHDVYLNQIARSNNSVFKICSYQWEQLQKQFKTPILARCLDLADRLDFLVRKDYNAQLRSFYAAFKLNRSHNMSGHHQYTNEIDIEYNEDLYMALNDSLIDRYTKHSQLYHDDSLFKPKNLVYFEDFQTPEKRLSRPVVWDLEPPIIDFEPCGLF